MALILLASVAVVPAAYALPSLAPQFISAQSTVPTSSGLNYPYRVAVDSNSDVYISDTQNNRVIKETLSQGVYTETVVATGLSTPYGVAVDSSQNVYIVDNGNVRVLKETFSSGTYTQSAVTTSALSYPTGIAVDGSGNVYICDTGHGRLLKESPAGSSYTESVVSSSGLPQITGVAVDSSGNVFVADIDADTIFEETYSAGSYTQSTVSTSGLNYPYDVTVDGSGNLYITDFANDRIVKLANSGGSFTQSVYPTANLTGPLGVAADVHGNLYIADTFGFDIKQLLLAGGNFGSVNVGSSTGPIYELFQFSGGAPSDTATVSTVDIYTQGAPSLDYTAASPSSCMPASFSAGDFCSISVNFSPQYPGARYGAAELIGTSPNFQVTAYIRGVGTSAMLSFFPGFPSLVAGTPDPYDLGNPFAAAVDAAGNVYIADYNNNAVYKEAFSNSGYTQSTIATGLNNPEDVAVDGAGNVYIVDSGNNQVLKETWSGSAYQQSTVASGLDFPTGMAVDGNGNVYISSFGDGAVYLETLSNGSYAQSTVVSGLNEPRKIAVDNSGNVYVANTGASQVVMETWTGSGYTQTTLGSGMLYPYGVAVDASGSVYVADTVNHRILIEALSGGTYTQYSLYPGATVYGIAVGSDGSLYVPDAETAAVYKLTLSAPGSLSFAATSVGVTSSDSPQSIEILNSGNAQLSLPVPTAGSNPSVPTSFNLDGSTTCAEVSASGAAGSLAAGGLCNYFINFVPTTTGNITGTMTLTDNSLNGNNVMQSIQVSGTGTAAPAPIVSLSVATVGFGNQTLGVASTSQSVMLTNTGSASLINTISVTGTNSADFSQTNNCPGTLAAASQCTVNVTFTPSVVGAETASLQFTDNAANSPETVALSGTGVNAPPPASYSIAANPTSLTIAAGQSGSTTLTITPVGGMTGTLTFNCTGLPANANCVFAPTTVAMSGNDAPATVTLTVNTAGANGVISQIRPSRSPWISVSSIALFFVPTGFVLLVIPGRATKKRQRYAYLSLLLLIGAFTTVGLTACGSISSSKATPAGQTSVRAVASVGGSNSQSAVVTVTITQ